MRQKEIESLHHVPPKRVSEVIHQAQSKAAQRRHAAYAVLARMDRPQARIVARQAVRLTILHGVRIPDALLWVIAASWVINGYIAERDLNRIVEAK